MNFFELYHALADRVGELKGSEVKVLWVLMDYRNNETGLLWPSVGTVAGRLNTATSEVERAIKSLTERGFLVTVEKGGGRRKSTVRRIAIPDAKAAAGKSREIASKTPVKIRQITREIPSETPVNFTGRTNNNRKETTNEQCVVSDNCQDDCNGLDSEELTKHLEAFGVATFAVRKLIRERGITVAEEVRDYLVEKEDDNSIQDSERFAAWCVHNPDKCLAARKKFQPNRKTEDEILDDEFPGYGQMIKRSLTRLELKEVCKPTFRQPILEQKNWINDPHADEV